MGKLKKTYLFYGMALLLCASWLFSCSDEGTSTSYDPSLPVTIETFSPDSGRIRTQFIIEGNNFGNDASKVKVWFNEKEALVLNVVNNAIYTIVPKQPGDSCVISVVVENDSVAFDKKKFIYHITESVSTVVGKALEAGNTDGSLTDATFQSPRWIAIDWEDNIIYSDESSYRVRLISLNSNEVITLFTPGVLLQDFAFTLDRREFYATVDNGSVIYRFAADNLWVPEEVGTMGISGYFHGMAMGKDPRYLYARQNVGVVWQVDLENGWGDATRFSPEAYNEGGGQGNIAYSPVEDCFYVVSGNQKHSIFRLSADGTTYEKYAGGGGIDGSSSGYRDGPADQALFNFPQGIAINSEGDIFIAEKNNHTIRKINHRTKIVSTVAGQAGVSGYEDGDPLEALFNTPIGLAFDKEDFLYIADQGNHCIRKLSIE